MSARVSVGSHYRGPEVGDVVWPHDKAFRTIVVDKGVDGLPQYVQEVAVLLRVSGSLGRFEGSPVEEFKFDRKDKSISVDWLIQESEWHNRTRAHMLRLFALRMRQTVPYMVAQCKQAVIAVDELAFADSMGQLVEQLEHAASAAEAEGG